MRHDHPCAEQHGPERPEVSTGPNPVASRAQPPRVRAVVVSWNGAYLLPDCLDSLLAQTIAADIEVVVVDNASTDETTELLAQRYPSVAVLRNETNLGFAGGADLGITGFGGEFVALLNNDATFATDAIERMVEVMEQPGHDRVGAVTAKILLVGAYRWEPRSAVLTPPAGGFERDGGWLVPTAAGTPDSVRVVNSTGNVVTRNGTGTDRDWLQAEGDESRDEEVFGFCGGAALLRTAALTDVGGFDRELFLYYEDTDLSWRLRAGGWAVRYCGDALALHRHAATSGSASPLFRYYNTRNSLTVFARHAPAGVVARSFARQLVGCLRAGIRGREPREVTSARLRGLTAFVARLPRTLRERTRWRSAAVSRAEVARFLSTVRPPDVRASQSGPGSHGRPVDP